MGLPPGDVETAPVGEAGTQASRRRSTRPLPGRRSAPGARPRPPAPARRFGQLDQVLGDAPRYRRSSLMWPPRLVVRSDRESSTGELDGVGPRRRRRVIGRPRLGGEGRRTALVRSSPPRTGSPHGRELHPPAHCSRRDSLVGRLRGLPEGRRSVGAPPALHGVRTRGVLRQLPEPSRHSACPRAPRPPDHPVLRAGRGLVVVLRRRARVRGGGASPSPSHP